MCIYFIFGVCIYSYSLIHVFFFTFSESFLPLIDLMLIWFFRGENANAVEILRKELRVFASFNEELFKEITLLLSLSNFRYAVLLLFKNRISCNPFELK